MTYRRIFFAVFFALIGAVASAQSWMTAYDSGLKAARAGDWVSARAAFQQAIALRPEDASGATTLPGPVSDRRQWRGGAPYSPNFLAAYSEYRIGLEAPKPEDSRPALQTAASEFETLLTKGQNSRETFFFLNQIYTRLGDTAKRLDLESRFASAKPNFRIDTEVVAPEEMTLITGVTPGGTKKGPGPEVTIIRPGQTPATVSPTTLGQPATGISPAVGPVPTIPTKFALIVGNSASMLKQGALTFGADDAQAVREAFVSHAGYSEANVDLVVNTTAEQLRASIKALVDRMPEDATVTIYFAGNGANIDGKDYLACVDTTSESDASSMVAKMDVYRMFMAKGAKIFAFFQVARPMVNGTYFGKEIPLVGSIAQVQATIPGGTISSMMRNGHEVGIFTDAVVSALQDIRSNRIPIMEFGWQIFNRTRGGGSTSTGGGARQVPTLPVLTHMSVEERF
jgi:hypothetical protein